MFRRIFMRGSDKLSLSSNLSLLQTRTRFVAAGGAYVRMTTSEASALHLSPSLLCCYLIPIISSDMLVFSGLRVLLRRPLRSRGVSLQWCLRFFWYRGEVADVVIRSGGRLLGFCEGIVFTFGSPISFSVVGEGGGLVRRFDSAAAVVALGMVVIRLQSLVFRFFSVSARICSSLSVIKRSPVFQLEASFGGEYAGGLVLAWSCSCGFIGCPYLVVVYGLLWWFLIGLRLFGSPLHGSLSCSSNRFRRFSAWSLCLSGFIVSISDDTRVGS